MAQALPALLKVASGETGVKGNPHLGKPDEVGGSARARSRARVPCEGAKQPIPEKGSGGWSGGWSVGGSGGWSVGVSVGEE